MPQAIPLDLVQLLQIRLSILTLTVEFSKIKKNLFDILLTPADCLGFVSQHI